jgi:nitrite reductase/ring-hydroxylating ferredoxin subunit/uncharacterized membrane protein
MINRRIDQWLNRIPGLGKTGDTLAHTLHNTVLNGGDGIRQVADLLHGTWMGHPLHPVLTDVVVGGWSLGLLFDVVSLVIDSREAEIVADALTAAGTVAAVPTILSGLADYSTIPHDAADAGLVHAVANDVAFVLQLASSAARSDGNRGSAIALSGAAMLFATAGAWLGGHLVYDKKVGVNHAEQAKKPEAWTSVLAATELHESDARQVEVVEHPVLLYRQGEEVWAIGAVCPHAGGPLEEGTFFDGCVQCPWHDSVFDLRDGSVVHGPSTYAVTAYDARIEDGQVQVRVTKQTS